MLTITENDYGKRGLSYEYRTTRRGGKGIVAMNVTGRNGRRHRRHPELDPSSFEARFARASG